MNQETEKEIKWWREYLEWEIEIDEFIRKHLKYAEIIYHLTFILFAVFIIYLLAKAKGLL